MIHLTIKNLNKYLQPRGYTLSAVLQNNGKVTDLVIGTNDEYPLELDKLPIELDGKSQMDEIKCFLNKLV